MSSVKRFVSASATYFIGNVLSKLALFLMVPLYTKYISPADYGYYDVSLAFLSIFTSALFLEIWSTVLRFMFDESGQDKYKPLYNGSLIIAISCLGYVIIACFISSFFSIPSFNLIVLYGIFFCWQNFYIYAVRGFGESVLFAVSGVVNTVTMIATNIILIVVCHYGYSSLYIASITGMIVQIIMIEYRLNIFGHFRRAYMQPKLIRAMTRYSLPLALNSICYWLLTDYNRIVILKQLGLYSNGLFAIAGKFAMAIVLASSCFTLAWQETAFMKSNVQEPAIGNFYSQAGNVCVRFLLCGSMILFPVISLFFPLMVDETYHEARAIIPLYLLATMVSIYSQFLGNVFGALKKTNYIFISTIGACLTNVIVVHTTISLCGLQAASLALLAGFIVNIMIRIYLLKKELNFRLDMRNILMIIPFLVGVIFSYCELSYRINLAILPITMITAYVFLKEDLNFIIAKIRGEKLELSRAGMEISKKED